MLDVGFVGIGIDTRHCNKYGKGIHSPCDFTSRLRPRMPNEVVSSDDLGTYRVTSSTLFATPRVALMDYPFGYVIVKDRKPCEASKLRLARIALQLSNGLPAGLWGKLLEHDKGGPWLLDQGDSAHLSPTAAGPYGGPMKGSSSHLENETSAAQVLSV
jgi:hypothetical protein